MPNRRVYDDLRYAHFLTFCVDRGRRLLHLDRPKKMVLGVLGLQLERQAGLCVGFVIMPDHVHALVWFSAEGQLSTCVHELKRQTSILIRAWYRAHAPNYLRSVGAEDTRFWQPGYHDFAIEGRAKLEEKLAYMHLNPVRAGLVDRAVDCPWSSAGWYEEGRSVGVPIRWVPGFEGTDE